jgi:hypothetical protein
MTDTLVIYENNSYKEVEELLANEKLDVAFVDWATNEVYVLVRGDWRSA